MYGYDTTRYVSPEQALDGFLRASGIPKENIPITLQDRSRLYLSELASFAAQGKRLLVIIDNVSTAEQARPLLPADGGAAALLTSRDSLDIEASLHGLSRLGQNACVELLCQALQRAHFTGGHSRPGRT